VILDGKAPTGPIEQTWDKHRFDMKLVNPRTSASTRSSCGDRPGRRLRRASLGELGYNVEAFCYQDSPRRAHQHRRPGRINAAKKLTRTTATGIYRLFYDTIKGGDFRSARRTSGASPR